MTVAYVTDYDPADILAWSGLGNYIYRALILQGSQVDCFGPLPRYSSPRRHMLRAKGIWYNRVLRQKLGCFSTERDHHVARFYAAEVMKRLQKGRYDVVVSPGSIPVAYVDSSVPIVIWT